MIKIKNKKDCCGCHACATACPRHCIEMQADEEGFLYPVADGEACIDCGLCEQVCPVINRNEPSRPLQVYAAKNKDEEVRRNSSSGGVFTLLAEDVVKEGGVVFGARFDKDWNVVHDRADTPEGIAAFRGSKYVQSEMGVAYREARSFLLQGRKVLFSGTPCQIAGLKKYLRKEYDNLLTVAVVCHGVPSPMVWRSYLEHLRRQAGETCRAGKPREPLSAGALPVVTDVSFRDKSKGWNSYGLRLNFAALEASGKSASGSGRHEQVFYEGAATNPYLAGFVRDLFLRPSCHDCVAREGRSRSDIVVADFWGVKNYHPEFDDNSGVSLVFLHTQKAVERYEAIRPCLSDVASAYEKGIGSNPSIVRDTPLLPERKEFWMLYRRRGIAALPVMLWWMKHNYPRLVYRKVKSLLKKYV